MPCSTTSGLTMLGCCEIQQFDIPIAKRISVSIWWNRLEYGGNHYDHAVEVKPEVFAQLNSMSFDLVNPGFTYNWQKNDISGAIVEQQQRDTMLWILPNLLPARFPPFIGFSAGPLDFAGRREFWVTANKMYVFAGPFDNACVHDEEQFTVPPNLLISCNRRDIPFDMQPSDPVTSPTGTTRATVYFDNWTNWQIPECCGAAPP